MHPVRGLRRDELGGELPAAGGVGRVVGVEEEVASLSPGMVAVWIVEVGIPAAGPFADQSDRGEGSVESVGAGRDVAIGAGWIANGGLLGWPIGADLRVPPVGGGLGENVGDV